MWFPLFLAFCFSLTADQCVAPLKLPPEPSGARLLQVQVLIRHGARAPGGDFYSSGTTQSWHCDESDADAPRANPAPVRYPRTYFDSLDRRLVQYQPSCREKDLLTLGMKQESELGRLFRDHYIVNLSLTNGVYDPSQFYGRATQLDRSLKSAIAFVQGLYPPASPNEVVAIVTDTPAAGILHPSESWCAELGDAVSTLVNSTAFVDFFASFTQKHRKTFEKVIGNWEPSKVKKFCSWSLITKCSGHSVPPELTDDVQNDCLKFVTSWLVDQCAGKFTGIAAAPLLREMFRIADDRIALASDARFVLLSSHDSAIAAVLPVLGLKVDAIPVRSHLLLELWEIASDVFCRFAFNGAPVPLPWLGGGSLVRYANLKVALAESGVLNHCRVPEWK